MSSSLRTIISPGSSRRQSSLVFPHEQNETNRILDNANVRREQVRALQLARAGTLPNEIALHIEHDLVPKVTLAIISCDLEFFIAYRFAKPTNYYDAAETLRNYVRTNKFEPGNPVYDQVCNQETDWSRHKEWCKDEEYNGKYFSEIIFPPIGLKYFQPILEPYDPPLLFYWFANPKVPYTPTEMIVKLDVPEFLWKLYWNVSHADFPFIPSSRRSSFESQM